MKKQFLALILALMLAALCAVPAMADGAMETINFSSGDVYVGEVVNGKPNGVGTYTLASGKIYHGDMVDGYFEGTGTYLWTDGQLYVGEFVHDRIEGKGMVRYTDGTYYIGEFANNKCHGVGTYFAADGSVIESGKYENGTFIGGATAPTNEDGLQPEDVIGDWEHTFTFSGAVAVVSFEADGTCVLNSDGETASGVWGLDGWNVLVDGVAVAYENGELHWPVEGDTLVFTRKAAAAGLTKNDLIGTWVLYSMGDGDSVMIADEVGLVATMTFKADGTCAMTLNGENYRDTWDVDPENSMLIMGDTPNPVVDGEIHLDLGGVTAIFVRQ